MFDPVLFKKHFPLFEQPENTSLVYLDNAATSQKPAVVIDAIVDFYTRINANANRSSHRLARAATEKIVSIRKKTAGFVHAKSVNEIVFTSGATESLNIVANGLKAQLCCDDEIVLSLAEHHANLVPWQDVIKKTGAKLTFINHDFYEWKTKLTDKVKVVSITAASNALGAITDLSIVKEIKAYNSDIIVIVDASQLVSHRPIDVIDIGCDFLFFSAHKMYGPTGVGILYGRKEYLEYMDPLNFGGEMITKVDNFSSEYAEGVERFEAGTSPLSAIVGFGAAIEFIESFSRKEIEEYEKKLIAFLHEGLQSFCRQHPDFRLLTEAKENIGIAALSASTHSLVDVAYWLDENDIAIRVGDHCAQPLWKAIGERHAVLRISIAAYNSREDVDKLLSALERFVALSENQNNHDVNIDDLLAIKNWQKRYKEILHLGKKYKSEGNIRQVENLVSGCEVDLWLDARKKAQRWAFFIDSDSAVVKGLALLIVSQVNDKTDEEIKAVDFSGFISLLGLDKYLSESRVNGLSGLIKKISSLIA